MPLKVLPLNAGEPIKKKGNEICFADAAGGRRKNVFSLDSLDNK